MLQEHGAAKLVRKIDADVALQFRHLRFNSRNCEFAQDVRLQKGGPSFIGNFKCGPHDRVDIAQADALKEARPVQLKEGLKRRRQIVQKPLPAGVFRRREGDLLGTQVEGTGTIFGAKGKLGFALRNCRAEHLRQLRR